MIVAYVLLTVQVQFWALRIVSWYASFTKKWGGHMLTPKIGTMKVFWTIWADRSDLSSKPVRPV